MYSVEISVKNTDKATAKDFEAVAQQFVEELQNLPDLNVDTQNQHVEDSRGVLLLLTGIVATGVSTGAFSAIYLLTKDLLARRENADVELKFKDGSVLKLRNLTPKDAEARIKAHLESGLAAEG